jgi:phosphatidylcholine synthase
LGQPSGGKLPGEKMTDNQRRFFVMRAWLVHFYTSLGLVCGLFGLMFIASGNLKFALILLGLAMIIDSTDGTMARAWKVTTFTPQFDGRKLDDITDYINYAFIPFFFAYRFGIVQGAGIAVLAVAAIAAGYGFCQKAAKTNDGYYTGFPNYWNFLIFYLYLFHLPPTVSAIILLVFSFLIWVPVEFASFSTQPLRKLTLWMALLYGIISSGIIYLIWVDRPYNGLVWVSLIFPLYYIFLAIYLRQKKSRA